MHTCTAHECPGLPPSSGEGLKVAADEEEDEEERSRGLELRVGAQSAVAACISVSTGVHSKRSRDAGKNHSPETKACPVKVMERRAFLLQRQLT